MAEIPFFLEVDRRVNRKSLKNSFVSTIKTLNPAVDINAAGAMSEGFISTYSESHGHYHNLSHIQHLLRLAGYFKYALKDPAVVQAAIWGHDLVQRKLGNDEETSAEITIKEYEKLGVPTEKIAKINSYILATKDHKNPTGDSDLAHFLDMDMAILGSPWERYFKYTKNIQREYDFYDPQKYKNGRVGFLEETMKQPIFKTPAFAPLEVLARTNMGHEIAWLKTIPRINLIK